MRVAIDVRKLHDYGIGTYVRNLVSELARQDDDAEYVLLCAPADREALARAGPAVPAARGARRQLQRARAVGACRGPWPAPASISFTPRTTSCRRSRPRRFVVTIHDCIHLRFPQYLPNPGRIYYARAMMRVAARRARRVLTVSQASKDDILHYLGMPDDKVEVIYNALDPRLAGEPTADDVARVRERFLLTAPFILYTGNIKPHKNVDRLIEAFADPPAATGPRT